jgi:excisionase family DNA binding protein
MTRRRCENLQSVPGTNGRRPTRSEPALVYTVAEVAERLKVSPGTVRNMIDQGQVYALRLHVRRVVVPKWALDDLVARPGHTSQMRRPTGSA